VAVLVAQIVAASVLIASLHARLPTPHEAATEHRTIHTVSLGSSRTDVLLHRVRADLGDSVSAVERFWGTDWTREITVVATGTLAQFGTEAHLDPRRQWGDIAAVAVADQVDLAGRVASGQRIVLAPGAADMSDSALRIVVTHELFHLAARTGTALDAPRWLTEGVADFVARPPAPVPRTARADTALPTDADLDQPGPQRSTGYDRAWWFARFVADAYGVDGLRRLYTRACGPGHADLGTAVREALGVDSVELQSRWAAWLTG